MLESLVKESSGAVPNLSIASALSKTKLSARAIYGKCVLLTASKPARVSASVSDSEAGGRSAGSLRTPDRKSPARPGY